MGSLRWREGWEGWFIIIRERKVWADSEVGKPESNAGFWNLVGLTHREGYWIGGEG